MSSFWDRRRAAVAAEQEAEIAAIAQAEESKAEAELDALPDDEILAKFDLPDPDTVDDSDAMKAFLQDGLPQRIKTRALRRLWRLNPVLANVDGLVDYGEDYTDAACVIEGMQTAYQVGKGMLAHVEALAAQEEAKAAQALAAEEAEAQDEEVPDAPLETDEDDEALIAEAQPDLPEPAAVLALGEEHDYAPDRAPSRRRMSFQFESTV